MSYITIGISYIYIMKTYRNSITIRINDDDIAKLESIGALYQKSHGGWGDSRTSYPGGLSASLLIRFLIQDVNTSEPYISNLIERLNEFRYH